MATNFGSGTGNLTEPVSVDDNSSTLSVDDGAGSLTVDNAGLTELAAAINSSQLDVNIATDSVGIGGGTQYTEDSAHNTGDTGTLNLAVRNDTLASLVDTDGDYAPLQVTSDGALYVEEDNVISTNNSTTSTLGISAAYTGTGEDVSNFASVTITIDSSHDSATDGMTFQFSTDNTNWDDIYSFTYTAADGARRFQFPVTAQYFRVVYTNGGTGQTHFRVQTILHRKSVSTSIHRIVSDVDPDRSANLVKAALIAQVNGTGDFTPIQSTASGILKIGGSVDVDDISAGTQTNDVKVTMDGETVTTTGASIYVDDADWTALTSSHQLIGGLYQSVEGTITDGDTGPLRCDVNGHLITSPHAESVALSDDVSNTQSVWVDEGGNFVPTPTFGFWYDGTTWDRARGDSANGLLVNLGSNNDVTNSPATTATATTSNVAGSASSVTLLSSNANRIGAYIYNDSTADLYVKLGATASTSSFTVKLAQDDFYELPEPVYTGVIDGIWGSATGNARLTEIT